MEKEKKKKKKKEEGNNKLRASLIYASKRQSYVATCHTLRKTTNIDGPLVLFLQTIIVSAS